MFQIVVESGSVHDKGEATVATNSTSPPKRKRRTAKQKDMDEKEQLKAVWAVLMEKISLYDFLSASFTSPLELVKTRVGHFYAKGGAAKIVRLWGEELEGTDNDAGLLKEAIKLVGERVQTDLSNTIHNESLRHPANSISRKTIKKFSLDRLRQTYRQSAPSLTLLLEELIPRDKPAPGSVEGWKPRDEPRLSWEVQDRLPSERAKTPSELEMESMSLPYPQNGETIFTRGLRTTLPPGPESSDSELESVLDPAEILLDSQLDPALSLEQQLEQDAEWENELDPHPEADPRCFLVVVAIILVFMKSQQANCLQMMIGVHLRGLSCPKRLIKLLSMIGLCRSYSSTTTSLKSLARDTYFRMRRVARRHPIFFLYDNINRKKIQRHQRSDKRNGMESQTTGTIVVGEDCHLKAHLFRLTLMMSCSGLTTQPTSVTDYARTFDIPPLNLLPVKRTKAYELAIMDIDQSTIAGNKQVIEHMRAALDKSKGSFKDLMMILAGDHLTISRIISIQQRSIGELTYFDQMQWAIPVLQLFHMQMILSTAILKTHFGHASAPGSLAFLINTLGRMQLKRDKPCYHTNDEFLRIVFRAMAYQLWQPGESHVDGSNAMSDNDIINKLDNLVNSSLSNSAALSQTHSITNTNALLFLKDMVVYIEFCTAIKLGDIGRIEQILKRITIMFQSGNNKNYGHELLRLNYNILHKWTEVRKFAVLSSMLMNTAGLPNRWIPGDLYQEHNNLLTKQTHATVGNNKSAAGYITPLIRLFRVINNILGREFRLPPNSKFHRVTKMDEDIQTVLKRLQDDDILNGTKRPTKHQAHPFTQTTVVDMMTQGFINLNNGGYRRFLFRMEEEKKGEMIAEDLEDLLEQLEDETNAAEEYVNRAFV
ncbi:hypothetical protein BGX29_007465 [Mortierella sp. GBA35]|nr:hypothetical protein BGX29_007465 [Mortierella sp. GBA35]